MRLYLLRHGLAAERDPVAFPDDSQRPLTPKGRRKLEKIAAALKDGGLALDHIVSSPFLRARESAHVVAKVFKLKVAHCEHLQPGMDRTGLRQHLAQTWPDAVNLMLVGHEPDLSELTCELIGAPSYALAGLKKGGLAGLELPSWESLARLEILLTPKALLGE